MDENVGYIDFDNQIADNQVSEVLTTSEKVGKIFRNKYVLVKEGNTPTPPKDFIGRIVDGPFYAPEEISRTSAIAQATILRGDDVPVMPRYFARESIEVLGEYRDKTLFSTGTRPRPKSEVIELKSEDIKNILGAQGNMFVGKLAGYEDVNIFLDANDKKVLPRNMGIFGTVGSGKSNTAQVIIEEAIENGYAVILFDVEGEYIKMDNPTKELVEQLKANNDLKPSGVEKMEVFYPAPADKPREDAKKFCVKFSTFDLYILFELLHATEAQERSFSILVEKLEEEKKRSSFDKKGPMAKDSSPQLLTVDTAIKQIWSIDKKDASPSSVRALAGKLAQIRRLGILDVEGVNDLKASDLLIRRKLSVIDVSSCSDHVKNITIVDVLKKIFDEKIENPRAPKTLIVIEEAHTFISKESRDKMEATIDMLKVIARRGRKRWLSLCFISQQPSHIPNEIFELCNTRIIHSLKSEPNIQAIKNTTGGVVESVWKSLPTLSTGQALIISAQLTHPILASIRPSKSERLLVD